MSEVLAINSVFLVKGRFSNILRLFVCKTQLFFFKLNYIYKFSALK